ncbi:biotin-dependent carboxyltransferase family protein [Streptomyces sp. V4-01]|uniref:Biotin-dependent carboxyltransferase family protein n=1 Tax=Actinacidiphila polyblastidii TaxID=3110430 RepID=A0ABU7PI76_9ACTN|nr:biotin-dependent carboxyltransferase family protein [Streptomyces sp. V4-01]
MTAANGRTGTVAAVLHVLRAGLLTTVQDRGRPGHAHLGVPRSGALDAPALALANRLVGNPPHAAGLETTVTGCAVRASRPVVAAVTGAACAVRVDGRPVAWGAPVRVPQGSVLEVGAAARGLRSYLAVAGGVAVAPVLGSRSTDLLSGLGPPPVADGSDLPVGAPIGPSAAADPQPYGAAGPRPGGELVLPLTPGPRDDWFTAGALTLLRTAYWTVSPASNRIGLRTLGPALTRVHDAELPSEGMVLGAVQVPPDGRPVVFLADHPTTGGYPVIGVVPEASLPAAAQSPPGTRIRFVPLRASRVS